MKIFTLPIINIKSYLYFLVLVCSAHVWGKGALTLENVTTAPVYAAIYQNNWVKGYNNKVGDVYTVPAQQTITLPVPDRICVEVRGQIWHKTPTKDPTDINCKSQSRRRLFVADSARPLEQQGLSNYAIREIDPSLWFSKVAEEKNYVVFYNGFFFDPGYAAYGIPTKQSEPDWRDGDTRSGFFGSIGVDTSGLFIYPNRFNVVEKTPEYLPTIKHYAAFQDWITKKSS